MAKSHSELIDKYLAALEESRFYEDGDDGFDDASCDLSDARRELNDAAKLEHIEISCRAIMRNANEIEVTGKLISVDYEDCFVETSIGNIAGLAETMELIGGGGNSAGKGGE